MIHDDAIQVASEVVEPCGFNDYTPEPATQFAHLPPVAQPLLKEAQSTFKKIEQMLYLTPSFIHLVKAAIPDVTLQAVLTDEQKQQLAKGVLQLMTKKDGTLLATLIDPKTKKTVAKIPLQRVNMAPDLTQAMTSFSTQMQIAQIAEQIQAVQLAVEEVRQGQEYDRLATAYSCQQKFLQAVKLANSELRSAALMHIAFDAEDSRNLLMLSQKTNIHFITEQPENLLKKIFAGEKADKINARMNEIRESLCAINMVSLAEAMAYQEMGENQAARQSLQYYADFLQETYLSVPGLVERLDLIDPSPENYWSKVLPSIKENIHSLPCSAESLLTGGDRDEEQN